MGGKGGGGVGVGGVVPLFVQVAFETFEILLLLGHDWKECGVRQVFAGRILGLFRRDLHVF